MKGEMAQRRKFLEERCKKLVTVMEQIVKELARMQADLLKDVDASTKLLAVAAD